MDLQVALFQAQEECAELIQAISKYNRVRGIGQKTEVDLDEAYNNLLKEIADVEICIEFLTSSDNDDSFNCREQIEANKKIAYKKIKDRMVR